MFKKYTTIENTYRVEYLERIKGHNFWDKTYVVQEKVHGANLSYYTVDGLTFHSAKRSGRLESNEKFYNHQELLEKHIDNFRSIYSTIKTDLGNVDQITIYGEVIGGSYPHKDVIKNNKASKVQKGIFYSPNNEFFAFDILLNGESYLDIDYACSLFEENNILHARTLFEGSLEDCLKYSNLFKTTIPKELGLPELDLNNCEGVVIKPKKALTFNNGVRVVLKNKNDNWAENVQSIKSFKPQIPLSEKVLELQGVIKTYINENRLNNVLSKMGEVTMSDFGKIIGSLNRDAIEDFNKDYSKVFSELDKKEQKLVTKSIVQCSSKLIKAFFRNRAAEYLQ